MGLVNANEIIVMQLFEEFQQQYTLKCSCDRCKEDILALVLNRLPPKYTSSEKGKLFIKSNYMDRQIQSDVMREFFNAAQIVESNQNHQ
ncbi:late competence development ComFB family protein [Paenibacillus chartarius]|uniref:Late competence development ComFB family protein n=1 Tax=Paenibacillus chartarius TaxID=747481 RepID=A0ABV6DL45_9BACL